MANFLSFDGAVRNFLGVNIYRRGVNTRVEVADRVVVDVKDPSCFMLRELLEAAKEKVVKQLPFFADYNIVPFASQKQFDAYEFAQCIMNGNMCLYIEDNQHLPELQALMQFLQTGDSAWIYECANVFYKIHMEELEMYAAPLDDEIDSPDLVTVCGYIAGKDSPPGNFQVPAGMAEAVMTKWQVVDGVAQVGPVPLTLHDFMMINCVPERAGKHLDVLLDCLQVQIDEYIERTSEKSLTRKAIEEAVAKALAKRTERPIKEEKSVVPTQPGSITDAESAAAFVEEWFNVGRKPEHAWVIYGGPAGKSLYEGLSNSQNKFAICLTEPTPVSEMVEMMRRKMAAVAALRKEEFGTGHWELVAGRICSQNSTYKCDKGVIVNKRKC